MASIRQELREYGLSPRKKLGQHFLVDRHIIDKVVRTAEVNREDTVLEIGPGLGEMTLALAQKARKVIAVEIDPKLVEILRKKFKNVSKITIIEKDILKVDLEVLALQEETPLKVVANLPYQISTPLLFRFLESKRSFSSLTLMLQREVIERITAPPGGKEYGALSVLIQMVSRPSVQFYVKPYAFYPPPRVESAVVRIDWRDDLAKRVGDEEWFREVVKASFSHRRKTLINSLKYSGLSLPPCLDKKIAAVEIDPQRRPETLSIEEFLQLAEALKDYKL